MCESQSITVECFVEIIFPGECYCAQVTVKRGYDMCGSQSITAECSVEIIFSGECCCAQVTVKRDHVWKSKALEMNVCRNHIAKTELSKICPSSSQWNVDKQIHLWTRSI